VTSIWSLILQLTSICFTCYNDMQIRVSNFKQPSIQHDMCQLLYIYSITPDDWLQICPEHIEVDWRNKQYKQCIKLVFFTQMYRDARSTKFETLLCVNSYGIILFIINSNLALSVRPFFLWQWCLVYCLLKGNCCTDAWRQCAEWIVLIGLQVELVRLWCFVHHVSCLNISAVWEKSVEK